DWVIAFDHVGRRAWLISTGFPAAGPRDRARRAARRLRGVRRALRSRGGREGTPGPPPVGAEDLAPCYPLPGWPHVLSNFDRPGSLAAVRRAIDYVHAGDCFQVNVAQRLLHPATLPPLEVYGRLRSRNPAPFAGYFDLGDFALASASPERFVRVEGGEV